MFTAVRSMREMIGRIPAAAQASIKILLGKQKTTSTPSCPRMLARYCWGSRKRHRRPLVPGCWQPLFSRPFSPPIPDGARLPHPRRMPGAVTFVLSRFSQPKQYISIPIARQISDISQADRAFIAAGLFVGLFAGRACSTSVRRLEHGTLERKSIGGFRLRNTKRRNARNSVFCGGDRRVLTRREMRFVSTARSNRCNVSIGTSIV